MTAYARIRDAVEPTGMVVRGGFELRPVDGCAARGACPVNALGDDGADQMRFQLRAFVGDA